MNDLKSGLLIVVSVIIIVIVLFVIYDYSIECEFERTDKLVNIKPMGHSDFLFFFESGYVRKENYLPSNLRIGENYILNRCNSLLFKERIECEFERTDKFEIK